MKNYENQKSIENMSFISYVLQHFFFFCDFTCSEMSYIIYNSFIFIVDMNLN